MRRFLLSLPLYACLVGCGISDNIILSSAQVKELEDHFELAVDVEQAISRIGFLGAYGDLDVTTYAYDEPDINNGWVGTLSRSGLFVFGNGDLTIQFVTLADGTPVDPFDAAVDLSSYSQVDLSVSVNFHGTDLIGGKLDVDADFEMATVPDGTGISVTTVNGNFDVDHDGYRSLIEANDFLIIVDRELEEIVETLGSLRGRIDLPDFPFDATFDVEGLGDSLLVEIRAALSELAWTLFL